jgi:uncharacterized protein (TIGR03437 family)
MNRHLVSIVVNGAFAAALLPAQIQIHDITLPAGGSAAIPVSLHNAGSISGIQFDLEYDGAAFRIELTAGEAIRSSAKQIHVADMEQRKRVVVIGANTDVIADGLLAYLHLSASATAGANRYPLRLINVVAVSPNGDEGVLTSGDAVIQVELPSSEGLSNTRIVNAASFVAGAIAPGEILTAMGGSFGAGPNDSQIICLIDGIASPIIHIDSDRFSAIVPDSLAPESVVTLQLKRGAQVVASAALPVVRAAPGIFTDPSTGAGQAVATHEDGSLNSPSNPVHRGSTLKLFATGTGVNNSVTVRTGSTTWEVLSAVAGIDIPGVTSVVARVPFDLEPGMTVAILVEAGGSRSQDGVTIAVR